MVCAESREARIRKNSRPIQVSGRKLTLPVVSVIPAGRIASLDVLRGFAVLGILVMNIQMFSMPEAAYLNPTAWGDLTGINLVTWLVSHLLTDTKFISIFSMLFGAGVCLFADRAEARGGRSASLHYRRMFWLLIFGLIHAYLLWVGDILVPYALCGCLVFLLWKAQPRTQALAGVAAFSVSTLLYLFVGIATLHQILPPEVVGELQTDWWAPTDAQLRAEVDAYRGGWLEQQSQRVAGSLNLHLAAFPLLLLWRCAGMMLLGMALYGWGVLSAARSDRFYRRLAVAGIVGGGVPILAGTWADFATGWGWPHSVAFWGQLNYWGGVAMALGYIGLVMLMVRRGWWVGVQARLAAVGRMAFTNYIAQTVICTTIFYGHGFGLFGGVERWQQALIVLGVWAVELWWSPLWLRRFRYGPLEWLWRTLTYGRRPG